MKVRLPRKYTVYQFYLVLGTMAALGLSSCSYIGHIVNMHYFPKDPHWSDWLFVAFFFVAAVVFLYEVFSLRYYKRYQPRFENQPNQSLQPTTMSVTDRAGARSAPATVVADL